MLLQVKHERVVIYLKELRWCFRMFTVEESVRESVQFQKTVLLCVVNNDTTILLEIRLNIFYVFSKYFYSIH